MNVCMGTLKWAWQTQENPVIVYNWSFGEPTYRAQNKLYKLHHSYVYCTYVHTQLSMMGNKRI